MAKKQTKNSGGRKARYTDLEIIDMIDQYYNNTFEDGSKLRYTDIATYAQSQGMNLSDTMLRKNKIVNDHILYLREKKYQIPEEPVVSFRNLNVKAFISKYRNPHEMEEALSQMDQYWSEVAQTAAAILKEKKEQDKQIKNLKAKLKTKDDQISSLEQKISDSGKENLRLKKENARYRKEIQTYISDAVAKGILASTGELEYDNSEADIELSRSKVCNDDNFSIRKTIQENLAENNLIEAMFASISDDI